MAEIDERLTGQFLAWERRGRGWEVYPNPVTPEPPFRPFEGHAMPTSEAADDGRKPTIASAWVRKLGQGLAGVVEQPPESPSHEDEPAPPPFERGTLVELPVLFPANFDARRDTFEHMLTSLTLCRESFAFEVQASTTAIVFRLAVHPADAATVQQQLVTFFPEVVCIPSDGELSRAWESCGEAETAVVEFGLAEPFMRLLPPIRAEPFVGLIGAMSELQPGELGLYQVLFQPVQHAWSDSAVDAVTHADGRAFFVNAPELADDAKRKVSRPLYASVLRLATRAANFDRAWELTRSLAGALRVYSQPNANQLIPLRNDRYPYKAHVDDVLRRQSRRTGMLLNLDELLGFVHFPTSDVRSVKLLRHTAKSKPAPASVTNATDCFLGWNVYLGNKQGIWLTPEQRVRHTHILGASGTGKSTLLLNLIRQDIEAGAGVGVLDPHGDLVDQILGVIPRERINEVILLDPSDEQFSIGFNILSAHSDWEKTLLASDLVSVFQRLSTSWGDQMGSVLNNAILAFLESTQGGTLADLRRFLLEPAFRDKFLTTVRDPDIVYYWRKGFAQLSGNKSIGPVLTRLETFLAPKPIRYMVSQSVNRLDFQKILDTGKIFLAKLPQGTLGKENAHLLGSLLMAKFQQTAMARQRQQAGARRDFWLYLDECHHFITPSTAEILAGARKYRVGLTLAHQDLRQLQRDSEVASAVMSNCCTRICFRVGDQDARALESGFSYFEARDLQNLAIGDAICRVEKSEWDFNISVPVSELPSATDASTRRREVSTASREKYATAREEIEAAMRMKAAAAATAETPPEKPKERKRAEAAPVTPAVPVVVQVPPSEPAAASITPPTVSPVASKSDEPQLPLQPKPRPDAVITGDPGRGGAQHKAIQRRLKKAAEELGYHAIIEHAVLDNKGSVDLALTKGRHGIACEISLTTTIDHEVGNVTKCLKAGFAEIAVVCPGRNRLEQIAAAVKGCLDSADAAKVGYFLPDELIAHLRDMAAAEAPPMPAETVRRGYKIKRVAPALTPEERAGREDAAIRLIAETMRRKTQ